jgi:hypothetical protein
METGEPDDKFENSISEIEQKNLSKMIKKDLMLDNTKNDLMLDNTKNDLTNFKNDLTNFKNDLILDNTKNDLALDTTKKYLALDTTKNNTFIPQSLNNSPLNELYNTENNTVGSKILNIINNKDFNFSDNKTSSHNLLHNNNDLT